MFAKKCVGSISSSSLAKWNQVQRQRIPSRQVKRWFNNKAQQPKQQQQQPGAGGDASNGAATATGGGGGGIGQLLLAGAVLAPPLYVAYMTRNDSEFRDTFKTKFPSAFSSVVSIVGTSQPSDSGSDLIEGMSISAVKKELDELEKRWQVSGSHEEKFSKDEVEKMKAKLEQAKKENEEKSSSSSSPSSPSTSSTPSATKAANESASTQEKEEQDDEAKSQDSSDNKYSVPPARNKLDAIRSKARRVKAKADRDTEKKIQDIERELRADLEVVLAHDLTNLDEEGLRARVVQLVLELKDRNRWEALRMHELTKKHTEDLVKKYDDLLREQSDKYEELIRYETAKAASEASDEMRMQSEDHLNRILMNKEQQWRQVTQQELDRQKAQLAKEMESRFSQAKASLEAKASEDLNARLKTLSQLKEKVASLTSALNKRSNDEKLSKQLRNLSQATLDVQDALYKNPKDLAGPLARLESAASGNKIATQALRSIPSRVKSNGVATELELLRRFDDVYDSCFKVCLVPEDAGVLEHAAAQVVAGLKIRGSSRNIATTSSSDSQEAHLSRARYKLMEENDVAASLSEMEQLTGLVRDTASDWISQAKDRQAVEQVLALIKSQIKSLSATIG